jgi:hypothetical protein
LRRHSFIGAHFEVIEHAVRRGNGLAIDPRGQKNRLQHALSNGRVEKARSHGVQNARDSRMTISSDDEFNVSLALNAYAQ